MAKTTSVHKPAISGQIQTLMADNYDPDNIRAKKHCRPPYGNEAT
jgi:hypothetical protein